MRANQTTTGSTATGRKRVPGLYRRAFAPEFGPEPNPETTRPSAPVGRPAHRAQTRRSKTRAAERLRQHSERNDRAIALFRQAATAAECEQDRIRKAVVIEYLDVADAIARRYSKRGQDWSDLRQVACVGLVKAAKRFDYARGDDFVSFAVPTISGEIKRHLRDNGWFIRPPRPVQELHSLLLTEVPRMTQRLGRAPAVAEIACELGKTPGCVVEALNCRESGRPVSLDMTVRDDEMLTLGDTLGSDDDDLERVELSLMLRTACESLTRRQRRILYLRFIQEQTQTQIATELGVTQMQVSRLLAQILDRLRHELCAEPHAA